jgi:hypothetical protein
MSLVAEAIAEEVEVEDKVITPSLDAIVNGIGSDGTRWKEVADVFSFTSSGVGFYMARQCTVGNLISLKTKMPPHLRCYDHDSKSYEVWGLVQHCHMSTRLDASAFQVGVAFIGKHPPATYAANPHQNYRICGMNDVGLWSVTESNSRFVQRKELRFWNKIDFYLALIDDRRETVGGERTSTENISKSGAAVITKLELKQGDRIKLINEEFDFSSLAIVCNSEPHEDGRYRINLEFIGGSFPVGKLKTPGTK